MLHTVFLRGEALVKLRLLRPGGGSQKAVQSVLTASLVGDPRLCSRYS